MSRPSRAKPASIKAATPDTSAASPAAVPDPVNASQVPPDPTGAVSEPASAAAEAAAAPVDPKPEAKVTKPKPTARVLIVKGPAKGRWRAGRHFTPEALVIPATELTEAQIEQIEADPELTCTWQD